MAREAGWTSYDSQDERFKAFAELVRADEREQALAAPVQEPFDHQQAASTALRESMNRSNAIAKNTVPTLQKRPQNCGTGYCSCVECVMEPAPVKVWEAEGYDALMQEMQMVKARNIRQHAEIERLKAAQPAPVPLTDEMRKQMKERCDSMEMRGAFADGWLSAEAAHGIKENT